LKPETLALECVFLGLIVAVVLSMGWFVLRAAVGLFLFGRAVARLLGRLAHRGAD
jgi:hypothetical protein